MADDIIEIEIVLDDGSIQKGFAKIRKESKKTAKVSQTSFQNLAKSITKAFLVVATIIQTLRIIKNITLGFVAFETSLKEIATITDDVTVTQKRFQDQLIATSAQFGTTASEQARSFYQIISAGITNATQANKLLFAANKLAIGGLTSTEGAIDLLTSTVNAFGQASLSAARAADIIFTTVRLGKTRVENLQSSLGLILPVAAALKVSFEEVAGAVAQLTTKGLSTSIAVTQLNAVFTAILKKQDAAKKLGPEVAKAFSLQALQAKGLTLFLKDLNKALGGSETKLTKLLGRAEGVKAILSLASDNFVGLADKIGQLRNSTGSADKAFKVMTNTIEFQAKRSFSTFNAILITLSQTVGGPVTKVFKELNSLFGDLLFALQQFKGVGGIFAATMIEIRIQINELQLSIIQMLQSTPILEDIFRNKLAGAARITKERIAELNRELVALTFTDGPGTVAEKFEKAVDKIKLSVTGMRAEMSDFNKMMNTALGTSISSNIQQMTKSLLKGENAFHAFGKVVAGIMGDLAIQLGASFVLTGLAINFEKLLGGTGTIAAGIGLIAVGTVLKSLAGGGGGATSPSITGADTIASPESTQFQEELTEQQMVNVTIQGDVFDSDETGLRIAEIINEAFDTNGVVVNAQAVS